MDTQEYHIPVLAEEATEALITKVDGTYVDATLGGGGYSERILKKLSASGRLIAFDTDTHAIDFASKRLAAYGERFTIVRENFGDLKKGLESVSIANIDGIVYDLGVSSHQFDTTSIGLSYRHESELDMRLDSRLAQSANDIIAGYSESELADIFWKYGEEPSSRRIAYRIVRRRAEAPITTTTELAAIIGEGIREDKRNAVLSRIFQALRIEVNDELGMLRRSLEQALEVLNPGGRLVVVSYHSLEDRIVKDLFNTEAKPKAEPGSAAFLRQTVDLSKARLRLITTKPVTPSEQEIATNVRARSAKMRVSEKI